MKMIEGDRPSDVSQKEWEYARFVTSLWDINDEEQAQEAVHSALSMLVSVAELWNPYWVMGLMETAKIHIYRNEEESDE